jgi:hypothetical protein
VLIKNRTDRFVVGVFMDEYHVSPLIEFLNIRIFNPILEAHISQYSSEFDQKNLITIQDRINDKRKIFYGFMHSHNAIREQFFREIYYECAENSGKILEDLELPRFQTLRDEFIELYDRLINQNQKSVKKMED